MDVILWVVAAWFANFIVGSLVCAYIDAKMDGALGTWKNEAPLTLFRWFFAHFWPIWLILFIRMRRQ